MSWYAQQPSAVQKLGNLLGPGSVDRGFVARVAASPAAPGTTDVLAATALADGATTLVTSGITDPDVPRCVQIDGNASGIAGNVVVTGTNINDAVITDTIAANGTTAVSGVKAFKTITSILLPAFTNDANDTISVGYDAKVGLYHALPGNTVILATHGGTQETTAPTVVIDADEVEKNVASLDTALDGSAIEICYIC